MRYSGRGQQTGGRRVTASTARWLVDGSVLAWCRRARAWTRRSVAGIGLPVSPERGERRESSSASPAASACPGPDGGAAGRGLSGVFRRPGLKMRRRADGGPASAANPANGTGRREPGRVRVRSLAARGLAAGLLAAFAALLALPLQGHAQTSVPTDATLSALVVNDGTNDRTAEDGAATDTYTVVVTRAAMTIPPPSGTALVSNLVQTSGGIGSLNSYDQAQAFTTGDNFGGYALTSVEIQTTSSPNLNRLTVSIRSDSSGSPDASLGTLMNLAAVASDGIATFTASGAGIDLERETTYFVMVDVSSSNPSGNIQNTASDAEDPGKAANWSIGDTSLYRNKGSNGSWTSFADSKKIRVNGAAKAGVGSTDAALTGLALKDAADGSTIDLNETFAAATKSYTADVGNAVAAVTVEPARSDSNATVAYLMVEDDASDTVLTDADTNTTGFQVALSVGANTIKVEVTAEDDLTTETYTVVVTRAAATATTLVTIAADAPTAIYNEGGASFTVRRTGATTDPLDVVVALTQSNQFLDAGDLLHTVTIAAGSSNKTLSFSAGDLLLPASETRESGTLTATVLAGTGYNPGTPATASVDVVVALTVSFDELSYRVDEGVGTLEVMLVGRTGVGAPAPASAWFSVSSAELNPPEAVSSEDYGSLSVSVQIPASAYVADGNVFRAEVPVDIEILDDARDEPDERLHLELQRSPGLPFRYSNFTDSDGVGCRNPICGMPVTITDNDDAPTVTLVLSPDSITENGGLSQITATLDHPSSEQTSIDISATAVPPLAVAEDFFMPPSRRLSIPIGGTKSVSVGHVVVLAIDNNVYSGNKFVTISGTAVNDMGIFQPQAQTLTIEDDESDPTATDATLSGLALKDAADDSTIALSPGFAPGTTSYTAIVGVGVDTITVEPTENDSNATVAYLDGSDTALTDTDVYKARFQAALAEGANTIKVKVTAADRSTIQTYTVTVTRATAAGVTVSETALTVTEEDSNGDTYTVVLNTQPTANVVVTVAGHSGTDVLPAPTTLTFTPMNWETAQTVTVTAVNDMDTVNDTVSLTHSAASTDTDYDGITIAGVPVTVEDNDTAQVTGLMLTPGDGELAVAWAPVPNATGYEVQWKSGGQGYNTSGRQATIGSGSTREPHDLQPHQRDHVHGAGESDPDGRQRRPVFGRGDGRAGGGGRHGVGDGADGDGAGQQRRQLHGGAEYPADGERRGDGGRACGHGRAPGPDHPDVHDGELGDGADGCC